ncbi:MAG: lipopolysaccharide biosynthesis protein [Bacteroidales bacterium]|jgi:O-antigen/teichoic acid export membrane protein|nr:lipopolysaccharide biosynthesis protein [Bacteroidales bacterium]
MSKTLKEKTATGIIWNFLDKFGQQGIGMLVGIILMRYFLSPDDYGLVALIAIFNMLGGILIDSGFTNALIRKKDVTQTDLSSVFYMNLVISLLFYLLIFFAAPFIAHFYEKPILIKLIRIMALSLPLYSLSIVQNTLLSKAIDFKRLASSNLIALFCSGFLSLFLAWKGWGVWVLVVQPISNVTIKNIYLWCVTSWYPSWIFSKQSIQDLWKYSSKLLASSTLSIICKNIYTSLMGIYYPLEDVGFYYNANRYSEISYQTIIPAIHTAVYPAMTKIENDPEYLKNAFRKTIRVSSFVFFPIMMGLIAIAEPLIHAVLGPKWLPIAPYFKVICVGYLFLGISALYTIILYIKGKSSPILIFSLLYNIALLVSIAITIRTGVLAMTIGWSVIGVVYTIIFTSYVSKKIQYTIMEQLKDIFPYFMLAAVMGIGVFLLSLVIKTNLILVTTQIIAGAFFYLFATYLLGSKVFQETIRMIKSKTYK